MRSIRFHLHGMTIAYEKAVDLLKQSAEEESSAGSRWTVRSCYCKFDYRWDGGLLYRMHGLRLRFEKCDAAGVFHAPGLSRAHSLVMCPREPDAVLTVIEIQIEGSPSSCQECEDMLQAAGAVSPVDRLITRYAYLLERSLNPQQNAA